MTSETMAVTIANQTAHGPALPARVHESVLAHYERRILRRIAAALPARVMPDHLTMFGLFGAAVTCVSYLACHIHPAFLGLASLGLVIHWLGDSLDGTLARLRKIERPRYGMFVDQSVDVITDLLIAVGLGLSPFARFDCAMLVLVGYHMMAIHALLRSQVTGRFDISPIGLGPTELRLAIIMANVFMYAFGAAVFDLRGLAVTWVDVGMALLFAALVWSYIWQSMQIGRSLAGERRSGTSD